MSSQPERSDTEPRDRLVDGEYWIELKLTTAGGTILGLYPYHLSVDTDERGSAVLVAFENAKGELIRELFGPFLGDLDE